MLIEELAPGAHGEWDDYVLHHPDATCYHLRAWQGAAEHGYHMRAPFLVARDRRGGRICGVQPLFVVSRPMGGYVTSGLFGAYGPILADAAAAADYDEVRRALVREAQAVGEREHAAYLIFKSLRDRPIEGFVERDTSVIATMKLDADPQVVWKRLRDKTRNQTRKAQKSGFVVQRGIDQLPGYYDVLAENMHRKGTPIYGIDFMRELLLCLGDRGEIVSLSLAGKVVSAALVIHFRDTVYVPFASSRPEVFKLCPNNLLYWDIIQRACERGMKVLDFGRSPRNSSTLDFKLHFGAVVEPMPFYIYPLRGEAPTMDSHDPGIKRLVRLWQRLPRRVADLVGPEICKRFLV